MPDGTPLVLAAAGSSDPAAMTDVGQQADLLAAHLDVPVRAAYLSAAQPAVADAVRQLRGQTGRPVAIASYLVAPGRFQDQLAGCGADWVTAPLGGHPALAGVVIDRYRTAARSR